jgi:hypothetical protein
MTMKTNTFLMTTLLGSGLLLGVAAAAYAAAAITTDVVTMSSTPVSNALLSDPRVAAQRFVAHVNYARVALAMKNAELARDNIMQARAMSAIIMNATTEQRRVAHVVAGRVMYEFDTEHKYNYFPIETGPVVVKDVSDGPMWAKNSLAVRDAEIVYLTLDLSNDKAEAYLAQAESDIAAGKFKEAEKQLGELTDAVVAKDSKMSLPLDKAHDNIGIAQNFIVAQNYDGARFALGHADDALDEMQKDDVYKKHHSAITAMRQEVKDLRAVITKKDPTMLQKTGAKLGQWMKELKAWENR